MTSFKSNCAVQGWTLALLLACTGLVDAQTGPMVGNVKTTEARFLYRPGSVVKTLRLSVLDGGNQVIGTSEQTSSADHDYVVKFHVTGLTPSTVYTYKIDEITSGNEVPVLGPADGLGFKTPLPAGKRGVITAGFASCANAASEPVWQRMDLLGVDQVFLMGDTPYIDTADLADIRTKHRDFLSTPFLSALVRSTPTMATWDDHDFGLNNGNGVNFASGKANTLRGFIEYRAHEQFGTGTEGVYHKHDLGVMEVFLLDPRWFSQTAPSPVDPTQKTAFGAAQWQWLLDSLKASRAPFKVLALGQVWQDKKNTETDDMFTYLYERDALFDFIRNESIPGVVLLGGDIHVSRYLMHPQRVGYDLHDFVTSPAHSSVIASLNVPHPSLEWSSLAPRQFLTLTADTRSRPAVLTARYILEDGTIQHEVVVPYDQLTPRQAGGLGEGLRIWLPFDGNTENQSILGHRVDATAVNGATITTNGLRGQAASFARGSQQYLRIPRSALDDNTSGYTASLWCKPSTLPAHDSADRHFLMESTLDGTESTAAAYSISSGIRAHESDSSLIEVELYTHTLQPAASTSTSPTALAQGPFITPLPRSLLAGNWTHIAVTFDRSKLRLYINGAAPVEHTLPVPGPVAEMGGLIIGGHRAGTGRNFDGLIDEFALWTRTLSAAEISSVYNNGTPAPLPFETSEADTDGDTLPDWWETLHDLDYNNPNDALADADADGVPAWIEREMATHPNSDDSPLFNYLRSLANPGQTPSPMVYRHPSRNSLTFRLALTTSSSLDSWTDLAPVDGFELSTSTTCLDFKFLPPGQAGRFFRFEATPPPL